MHLAFLTPSPDPAGGGRSFNQGLVPALRQAGHQVHVCHDAEALPPGATPVVDGLLLPDLEPRLATLLAGDAVAVIHHVAARAGRNPALRQAVQQAEGRMLPLFRRVVATSAPVAERLVADLALAPPHVLEPGLPDLPRTPQSDAPPCRILCVGVLTPRKGHDRLLHALARLTDLDWTLTVAGDAARDPAHTASIPALAATLGLAARLDFRPDPSPEALAAAWDAADLFALATSWEGYPAGLAEALRRGIPVVTNRVGGVEALVPPVAGIVAAPDDPATFSKCLRRAIFDTDLRARLADGAWQAGRALPGWPQQAAAFAAILER